MNLKSINLKTVLAVVGVIVAAVWYFMSQPKQIEMSSKEAVETVLTTLGGIDTTRCRITEVAWSEDDKMTNNLRYVNVIYMDADGNRFRQNFDLHDTKKTSEPEQLKDPISGIKERQVWPIPFSALDAGEILTQLKSVVDDLPEELVFRSVARYSIDRKSDSGDYDRRFTVLVTKKGEKSKREGRHTVTTYYELKFVVAPDGTVTLKE